MKQYFSFLAIIIFMFSGAVNANSSISDDEAYIGIGLGNSEIESIHLTRLAGWTSSPATNANTSDSISRLFIGSELNKFVSYEFGYSNLGTFSGTVAPWGYVSLSAKAFDASIINRFRPDKRLGGFFRVGFYRSTATISGPVSGEKTAFSYLIGLGGSLKLSESTAIRFELLNFAKMKSENTGSGDLIDIETLSASLVHQF